MATIYDDLDRAALLAEIQRWKEQAAKNATTCVRQSIALKMARQFGVDSRAFHGGASNDLADWIDGGMKEGLLWPTSPVVAQWLTDQGYSRSSNGMITIRATMTLVPETAAKN